MGGSPLAVFNAQSADDRDLAHQQAVALTSGLTAFGGSGGGAGMPFLPPILKDTTSGKGSGTPRSGSVAFAGAPFEDEEEATRKQAHDLSAQLMSGFMETAERDLGLPHLSSSSAERRASRRASKMV